MAYVEYPVAYVEYPIAYFDYPVAYFDYIFLYIFLYIPMSGLSVTPGPYMNKTHNRIKREIPT